MESSRQHNSDELSLLTSTIKNAIDKFRVLLEGQFSQLTIGVQHEGITTSSDSLEEVVKKLREHLDKLDKALKDFKAGKGNRQEKIECLEDMLIALANMQRFLNDARFGAYQSRARRSIINFLDQLITSPQFQRFNSIVYSGKSTSKPLTPVDYAIYKLIEMTSEFDHQLIRIREAIKHVDTHANEEDTQEKLIAQIDAIRKKPFKPAEHVSIDDQEEKRIIEVTDLLLRAYTFLKNESSAKTDFKNKLISQLCLPDISQLVKQIMEDIKSIIVDKEEFWKKHNDPIGVSEIHKILNGKHPDHIKLIKIIDLAIKIKDKPKFFTGTLAGKGPREEITGELYKALSSGNFAQIGKVVAKIRGEQDKEMGHQKEIKSKKS